MYSTLWDKITVCSSTHLSGGRDLYLHRNVYDFTYAFFLSNFFAFIIRYSGAVLRTFSTTTFANTVLQYCTKTFAKDLVNTKY